MSVKYSIRIHYELLIILLKKLKSVEDRAILLQTFISEYGPIPNEFGEEIRNMIHYEI